MLFRHQDSDEIDVFMAAERRAGSCPAAMIQTKNMADAISDSRSLKRRSYSVRGLANWILDFAEARGFPITNMALNKLIFLAFERMLLERRVLLTNAKIEAWEHGPVFREVYQSFKEFGDRPISARSKFFSPASGALEIVTSSVAPDDEVFLKNTLAPLISLSASRLRALSHAEGGAWHQVWWHDGDANPGMEITPVLLLRASEEEQFTNGQH
jgi:uncharacterized phage-associated protein